MTAAVEWLVDTGADVGVIQKQVGDLFDTHPVGASASPTTGGGGILMITGIDVAFDVEDPYGTVKGVSTARAVGVKSNNAGGNIIGVDQLADVGARVEWDPATRSGRLLQ